MGGGVSVCEASSSALHLLASQQHPRGKQISTQENSHKRPRLLSEHQLWTSSAGLSPAAGLSSDETSSARWRHLDGAYVKVLACCFQRIGGDFQPVLRSLCPRKPRLCWWTDLVGGAEDRGGDGRLCVLSRCRISLAARAGRGSDVAALEKRLRQPLMVSADDGAAHTFQG